MIIFELICSGQHRFEGWFASADAFAVQRTRGELQCPICADRAIEKLLTAKIGRSNEAAVPSTPAATAPTLPMVAGKSLQEKLNAFLDHVLTHTEDVGAAFAEEARKIHHEQVPARDIRGVATASETRELLDEGIQVLPLPIPRRDDWH